MVRRSFLTANVIRMVALRSLIVTHKSKSKLSFKHIHIHQKYLTVQCLLEFRFRSVFNQTSTLWKSSGRAHIHRKQVEMYIRSEFMMCISGRNISSENGNAIQYMNEWWKTERSIHWWEWGGGGGGLVYLTMTWETIIQSFRFHIILIYSNHCHPMNFSACFTDASLFAIFLSKFHNNFPWRYLVARGKIEMKKATTQINCKDAMPMIQLTIASVHFVGHGWQYPTLLKSIPPNTHTHTHTQNGYG